MPVRDYTDKEILDRLSICDGWSGLPNGILDVWIRSDEDDYNRFDDKVYTFDCSNGTPRFVMVSSGTSNAGSEGLKHYDRYNREGCAILNGNQIVYQSHGYGLHKGKYPAYRQVRPFPYYRDGDKDNRAEETGALHNDIIGANCHKAGWFSTEIGGWSVACLVRNQQEQFDKWMAFMAKRPLTVAILDEWTPDAGGSLEPVAEMEQLLEVPEQAGPSSVVVTGLPETAQRQTAGAATAKLPALRDAESGGVGNIDLRKESPSVFTKIIAAGGAAIAFITNIGLNLQSIFDRTLDAVTPGRMIFLGAAIAIGLACLWFYDRSAQRANKLNLQKIGKAADQGANTVELK